MPCDPQCPVRRLNNQLINMKQVKIATLRQIQEVTDEIGRHAPYRRDEVERNTFQIQTKLVLAMRELASLTDEIALGCDTCQANNET
jgi:hypothetical protein